MKESKCKWVRLGDYIINSDLRNSNSLLTETDVRGLSTAKKMIETKANLSGVNLSLYKVVRPEAFAYVADTSRRGDKISLGFNMDDQDYIVSNFYVVFEVKDKKVLNPWYLYLIFNRSEFDRYARWDSWGSAREYFWFDDISRFEFPLPSIEEQQKVVNAWKALREIKEQNEAIAVPLMQVCQSYIQELKHKYESVEIGPYMRKSNKNTDGTIDRVLGVGQSGFIPPQKIPNENLKNYKVMSQHSICYAPPMYNIKSGAIQLYTDIEPAVCSPIYEVFHVDDTQLLPTFLIMWLKREEFIRYADFYSLGVRNTFSYESMEKVRIPLPPLDVQQSIVNLYNCANEAKKIAEEADKKSREICPALIQYVINN